MNKENTFYTIIFTFVISFLFVLLLAFTNEATREQVQRNREIARQKAILNAMNISYESEEEVTEKYESVSKVTVADVSLYKSSVDGRSVYAKEFQGSGLWGQIYGVLGIHADGERLAGLDIISHNETPGLGGRIDEPWFKKQFSGEEIVDGTIELASGDGDEDYDNGRVDAITGATRTSQSIKTIVNREIETLREVLEEGR
jgi:Na+-transporting NADH:ubiquinone oxidoreductase subunit C